MDKIIVQYQKAFNSVVERLKSNSNVLAVMVFGSMVSGDLWDESDIDLFVIIDNIDFEIKNIYTEENDVNIHIKLMSKEKLMKLNENDLRGGFIHRVFASSRLVFSRNFDVTTAYNNGRYYPEIDRERWNLVYLGKILKSIGICKKYLMNAGVFTSYSVCVRCIEDYSKLYVNSSGYMVSKDAMTAAMNFDDSFKEVVEKLFFSKENTQKLIEDTISYIEKAIELRLKNCTVIVSEFFKSKDKFYSTEDMKNAQLFEGFDIDFEDILNYMWRKKLIKRGSRDYNDNCGDVIIKENVYFI
jgi:uncharacterized protein